MLTPQKFDDGVRHCPDVKRGGAGAENSQLVLLRHIAKVE
jgi:hypothetical protein